jgi:hypothetical protein
MDSYQMIETAKANLYALTGLETTWQLNNGQPNDGTVSFKDNLHTIVPLLLIYADLMDTRDQRCIEEAQQIYKEYVEN